MSKDFFYEGAAETDISPIVSVIVPIYNAENTLERCLSSIKNQSYTNFEVIMINDGSTDNSESICKKFVEKDKRYVLYTQENRGVSSARNLGLKKVKGRYIQFIDSDDEIAEECINNMLSAMICHCADMVVCGYYQVDEKNCQMNMQHFMLPEGVHSKRKYIWRIAKCPGAHYVGVLWNKLYKVDFIKKSNLLFMESVSLGEDFIFNTQYLYLVQNVCCISQKLYIYQWQRQDSLCSRKKKEDERIEERVKMYHAYAELFKHEHLNWCWRPLMHYYILKAYFDELEYLGDRAVQYYSLLYQRFIHENGIGKVEFRLFRFLKRWKKYLNKVKGKNING